MKITLDVDPKTLSSELSNFMETLTPEDKKVMVTQVLNQYYSDFRKFEDSEFENKEKELIDSIRSKEGSYLKDRYSTDEGVRESYEYQEARKKFNTFSQKTREEISSAIRYELTQRIKSFIETDETYQSLLKESMESVKERFPIMVQAAMVAHMSSQMNGLQNQIYQSLGDMSNRLNEVEQKLIR